LWVKPGAYPGGALMYAPVLLANIRLGWKGLLMANAIAYHEYL